MPYLASKQKQNNNKIRRENSYLYLTELRRRKEKGLETAWDCSMRLKLAVL